VHGVALLHKHLKIGAPQVHKTRLAALLDAVAALTKGRRAALVALGRHIKSHALIKHNIKKVDRLLGNQHLHVERVLLYRALAKLLVAQYSHPVILVDWSGLTHCGRFHFIRAALPFKG
jgi:hypothetical protein